MFHGVELWDWRRWDVLSVKYFSSYLLPVGVEQCKAFKMSPIMLILYRWGVVNYVMLLRCTIGIKCTLLGILLCVSLFALDVAIRPRHDFICGIHQYMGKEFVEFSSPQTIMQCPYKHFILRMYEFGGSFVQSGRDIPKQFKGPLADIEKTCGWHFLVLLV